MARERAPDPRFDSRGGVNTAASADLLDKTEVRAATNVRLTTYGSHTKATGSRRLHDTALAGGAAVLGVYQWDAPAGKQIVAIAGGNLYHKLDGAPEFTEVAADFSTTRRPRFTTQRIGAAIKLYIADGIALRQWDGAMLTTIASAPAARDVTVYLGRGFATDGTKRLYWSKIGDMTLWAPADGGGFADVETRDTEPLTGIGVVGSSLLLGKGDSIARFTGVDPDDIQIATETEGVAAELGIASAHSFVALEQGAFGISDRGAFLVSEAAADRTISVKVEREFLTATGLLQDAIAVHHRRRGEVWVSWGDVTWVYALAVGAWSGPWTGLGAESLARYERPDGTESIMSGGTDGFVREEDIEDSARRDVHRDGTGGAPVGMVLDYGAAHFGDPTRIKSLVGPQSVEADLGEAGELEVAWESELGSGYVRIPSVGPGLRDYTFRLRAKGRRIRLIVRENTDALVEVAGFVPVVAIEGKGGPRGAEPLGAEAAAVGLLRFDGTAAADGTYTFSGRPA